jgi:3-deoxy-7-phosphoheptulonate synthase
MGEAGRTPAVMIDCSHANAGGDYRRQEAIWHNVIAQVLAKTGPIVGMMVESNINEGKQPLLADRSQLKYGVSLTDGCIGWDTTERLLHEGHHALGSKL